MIGPPLCLVVEALTLQSLSHWFKSYYSTFSGSFRAKTCMLETCMLLAGLRVQKHGWPQKKAIRVGIDLGPQLDVPRRSRCRGTRSSCRGAWGTSGVGRSPSRSGKFFGGLWLPRGCHPSMGNRGTAKMFIEIKASLSGFVCAYHPSVPYSSPKHIIFTFCYYVLSRILLLKILRLYFVLYLSCEKN